MRVSNATLGRVRDAAEPRSGWAMARKSGRAAVPAGDATNAIDRLIPALADRGVHVVPSGAVESLVKAVGNKGPKWVVEAIERGLVAEAVETQAFVRGVLASFEPTSEASVHADETYEYQPQRRRTRQ